MSDLLLEARDVTKVLGSGAGQVHALKEVTLSLRGGELAMLMGPSGSGKTTLMSILGCMLAPTAGEVRVCGHSVESDDREQMSTLRRNYIGFVFQSYHLFATLTAVENVQLALDVRGRRGRDATMRSCEVLASVGLGSKFESYPLQLSGGEQQRVAIARSLVSNPSIILADEPTAALDTVTGRSIMELLSRIAADRKRGVLVVTHDTRLMPFADRILSIEDGRIVGETPAKRTRVRRKAAKRG